MGTKLNIWDAAPLANADAAAVVSDVASDQLSPSHFTLKAINFAAADAREMSTADSKLSVRVRLPVSSIDSASGRNYRRNR